MLDWLESSFNQALSPRLDESWQIFVILFLWLISRALCNRLGKKVSKLQSESDERISPAIWIRQNTALPLLVVLLIIVSLGFQVAGIPVSILWMTTGLFTLWTVIGIITSLLRDKFWADSTAVLFYLLSAFTLLSVDDTVIDFLDRMELPIAAGDKPLTVWGLFVVAFSLAIAVWIGLGLSQFVEKRIDSIHRVNPSTRALFQKVIRVFFIIFALVIGLTSVGINLSALAIFGGAFALGVGFGLQKIVSNLISGFILLSDRSIKPGDVIELDGTYGWINSLRGRYVSVITRDGTEHLIPNEDLITQRVVNWSFSNNRVRIRCKIGVAYKEDPHRIISICKEATMAHPRILKDPPPACLLTGFGDSSLDLELRFWIEDPNQGVANLRSAVLLTIWDRFKEEGIEIPFPQRDIHLRNWPSDPIKGLSSES